MVKNILIEGHVDEVPGHGRRRVQLIDNLYGKRKEKRRHKT